jgi:hypothetical protein
MPKPGSTRRQRFNPRHDAALFWLRSLSAHTLSRRARQGFSN